MFSWFSWSFRLKRTIFRLSDICLALHFLRTKNTLKASTTILRKRLSLKRPIDMQYFINIYFLPKEQSTFTPFVQFSGHLRLKRTLFANCRVCNSFLFSNRKTLIASTITLKETLSLNRSRNAIFV